MSQAFNAYELNPDIKEHIEKLVPEEAMQEFLVWLLEWEGERLDYARVPSLADITKKVDELAEAMNEDS